MSKKKPINLSQKSKTTTVETTLKKPKISATSSKKKKAMYLDGGIGPRETEIIRTANRLLWQRSSLARKIVLKRCLLPDGHSKCEFCDDIVIKVKVDHTVKVGLVDMGFLSRLWCSSSEMTGMCDACHNIKTRCEEAQETLMSEEQWTKVDVKVFGRATNILVRRMKGTKRVTAKSYRELLLEAITEESKVNEEDLIALDPDIVSMDLWTYEKIKLQKARNANKKDFSLDELIGKVTPSASESLTDLF